MSVRPFALLTGMLMLLASTGCCRFCDHWCGPRQPQYAPGPPAQVVVPAASPVPYQAPCCVPCPPCCVPTSQFKQPVTPVPAVGPPYGQAGWAKQYSQGSCCN
jgi:hypothetical protein